jgi:hypothetical protein
VAVVIRGIDVDDVGCEQNDGCWILIVSLVDEADGNEALFAVKDALLLRLALSLRSSSKLDDEVRYSTSARLSPSDLISS